MVPVTDQSPSAPEFPRLVVPPLAPLPPLDFSALAASMNACSRVFAQMIGPIGETFRRLGEYFQQPEVRAGMRTLVDVQRELTEQGMYLHRNSELGTGLTQ